MGNWDELYKVIQNEHEAQKKKNFEVFMNTLSEGIEKDIDNLTAVLDKNYAEHNKDYEVRLELIKMSGCRVFRNKDGKHLIKKA